MTRCSGCCKWLDLQSDSVAMDEGTLCQECFTEWYGETATTTLDNVDIIRAGGTWADPTNAT